MGSADKRRKGRNTKEVRVLTACHLEFLILLTCHSFVKRLLCFLLSSKQDSIEDSDLPKKRGRPKAVRSNDDSPVTSARSKAKSAEKDAEETPKAGSNLKNEGGRWPRKAGNKDEAGSKHKSSKDEAKSSASDGSKTNGVSAKRKPKEKEVESSEEEEPESAKASTGKKRRRKFVY